MNVQISSKRIIVNDETESYIKRRVLFGMGRLKGIDEVAIRLSRRKRAKGSGYNICQVRVQLKQEGIVLIEDSDTDLFRLIHRAVERAGFAVSKTLTRHRQFDRIPAREISSKLREFLPEVDHPAKESVASPI